MTIQDFTLKFQEQILMMETGQLTPEVMLSQLEQWDSMAVIETLAFIDHNLEFQVTADQLLNCSTFGDILNLISHMLE